jgi:hypothetical protein
MSSDEIICIFCTQLKRPSREHIIPKALGGNFVINQVCKDCNDILGRIADCEFDANSYIAAAYKKLGWQEQLGTIIKKAEITAIDMKSLIPMKMQINNNDEFQVVPQALENGSYIVREEESIMVINKIIDRRKKEYVKKGLTEEKIEHYKKVLIRTYEEASQNTEVDSPELGFKLVKHSSELEMNVEYSKKVPLRGISKIGYELLFLLIGHGCFEERFDSYRKYPLGEERIPPIYQLFPSGRELSFSPIHQLYMIGKNMNLIGGVKLFRGYAWEINFGLNNIDAFQAFRKFSSGKKVEGIGIQMNLENNLNYVFIKTESGKWEHLGSVS